MTEREIMNVFPTQMAKQLMKTKLKIAEKGHTILKKKSEVLEVKFRKIAQEIIEIKRMMGRIIKEARYLLAETKYVTGDINTHVLNNIGKAHLKVRHRVENIAGVKIICFECYEDCEDQYGLAGLAKGGMKLTELKRAYSDATEILVQVATLQTGFIVLDKVLSSTNRRVNALEHMYIPKIENTIRYIINELDENERQEFFRLKMVKNKKERIAAEKEEMIKAWKEASEE